MYEDCFTWLCKQLTTDGVTAEWKRLHIEEHYGLYSSLNIIG